MDKRGETYDKGFYSLAVYDIGARHVGRVKYYEYWLYGEKMEKDYKTSTLNDDEDMDSIATSNKNNNNNNKMASYGSNNMASYGSSSASRGQRSKYGEGNSGKQKTDANGNPFVKNMMQKHMVKMEL